MLVDRLSDRKYPMIVKSLPAQAIASSCLLNRNKILSNEEIISMNWFIINEGKNSRKCGLQVRTEHLVHQLF